MTTLWNPLGTMLVRVMYSIAINTQENSELLDIFMKKIGI